MKKISCFSVILFSMILLASCNKTKHFDKLDVMTSRNWNLVSISRGGVVVSDSCDLDDVLYFENASVFTYDNGLLNCNKESALTRKPKSWRLIDDYTVIRLTYKITGNGTRGSMVEYWKIMELTDSSLVLKDNIAEGNGQVPEYRTYK